MTRAKIVSIIITENKIYIINRKDLRCKMGKDAKRLLMNTTWQLVLKKGFKAVKVQEICAEAGVSKMTFYYYFDNKQQIIEVVLDEWLKGLLEDSKEIMSRDIPFRDRIIMLVEWKADFVKSMSPAFLKELYAPDGKYAILVKNLMEETQTLTYKFFTYGKEHGEINKNVDVKTIMMWMGVVSDMIIDGKFNHLFDDPAEMNKQIRELMLYGVMGSSDEENYSDLTMF